MNRELMLKVADVIEKEPHRYEQGCWMNNRHTLNNPKITKEDYNLCGTQCCIAGHAVLQSVLAGTRPENRDIYKANSPFFDWVEEASKDLGITEDVASLLFDADFEPTIPVPELLRKLANHSDPERQLEILETYA